MVTLAMIALGGLASSLQSPISSKWTYLWTEWLTRSTTRKSA
jgi:hypothetical protein